MGKHTGFGPFYSRIWRGCLLQNFSLEGTRPLRPPPPPPAFAAHAKSESLEQINSISGKTEVLTHVTRVKSWDSAVHNPLGTCVKTSFVSLIEFLRSVFPFQVAHVNGVSVSRWTSSVRQTGRRTRRRRPHEPHAAPGTRDTPPLHRTGDTDKGDSR